MKPFKLIALFLIPFFLLSCKKEDDDHAADAAGYLGEVGNEWNVTFNGEHSMAAKILSNTDGLIALEIVLEEEKDTVYLQYDGNRVSEYIHSNGDLSKPFTMVEFDAEVGDSYSVTIEGATFYREVTERETYYIDCLEKEIETIGVYEVIPYWIDYQLFGITIRTIIWYWHPTYGLVCVDIYTDDGEHIEIVFINIEL